ncbi:unnamed protein product, partial [Prorocentrum cordatum]
VMRDVASGLARESTGFQAATDDEDKLGVVMRFLRAAEQRCLSAISRCLIRYPRISEFVCNPYDFDANLSSSLLRLRDHAVELARDIALTRMQASRDDDGDDWMGKNRKRKKGSRLLFRLSPGRGGGLGAIVDRHGRVVTDSRGMANILRSHWAATFAATGVDENKLGDWLADDAAARAASGPPRLDWGGFRIRRKDISAAIRQAKNCSPGPDGIPYGAWRALGSLAVDTLHNALRDLASPDGQRILEQDFPDFNESLLFFLPKSSNAAAPDGTPAYEDLKAVHFPDQLVDMSAVAVAAKARVHRFEADSMGGLQVEDRIRRLEEPPLAHCSLAHSAWVSQWVRNSFLHILSRAAAHASMLLQRAAGVRSWISLQAGWQGQMTKLLAVGCRGEAMRHFRRRLDRWRLDVLPGRRMGRALRVLDVLARRSVPRIQAAFIRTVTNGWCTRHRFQQRGHCPFRCGAERDSIEHLACCSAVRALLSTHLHGGSSRSPQTLDDFLCLSLHASEEEVVSRGVGLYAIYRLFNALRNGGLAHN